MRSLILLLLFSLSLFGDPLEESLSDHISIPPEGETKVGKIAIDDKSSTISQATWVYVKNALEYYKKEKPAFIILELNTPGGEVFSAQKISDALKEMDIQYGIPVVAFINNWAISAGAMLAYSSRYIAVAKDASMGAAEPVIQQGTELKEASEKVNSAFRTDFANRARFFDRDPDIAEAMVDKDIILVYRDGKVLKLDDESQIIKTGAHPDHVISAKGKLLTLDAEQLMKYGVANILLKPERLPPITEEELEKGVYSAKKELLFTYPFFNKIANPVIHLYPIDWKTRFFMILAHPMVSSFLMLVMMVGFYMEFNTPGFGIPGTLAITALLLLALSSFSQEIADQLELILLLVGLILFAVDLFLIPTFGLLGIIGILLFLAGFLGMLLPGLGSVQFDFDSQTFNAAGELFIKRLAYLSGTFVLGMLLIFLLARFFPPSFLYFRRLVLQGHEQEGYIAGVERKELPEEGRVGVALSLLRPSGKVQIEGEIFDAICRGRLIEKGVKVKVVGYEGSAVVVEEA